MIDDAGLTDEQWVDYWLDRQRERMTLIDRCIAAKSLRPFANFLFHRAKRVYELAKARHEAAVATHEYALTAYQLGQQLANRQLIGLAGAAAKAQAVQVGVAEATLDTARELVERDLVRAARLLAHEPHEPVYSRTNPEPGIPSWYYPPQKGSTDGH
jgi:hypothetical protein